VSPLARFSALYTVPNAPLPICSPSFCMQPSSELEPSTSHRNLGGLTAAHVVLDLLHVRMPFRTMHRQELQARLDATNSAHGCVREPAHASASA
jgi:hypothetical protein